MKALLAKMGVFLAKWALRHPLAAIGIAAFTAAMAKYYLSKPETRWIGLTLTVGAGAVGLLSFYGSIRLAAAGWRLIGAVVSESTKKAFRDVYVGYRAYDTFFPIKLP